jgi:ABC-type lipopolysaccharide export system ATPase subunit
MEETDSLLNNKTEGLYVKNLVKKYKRKKIISGIDLQLNKGEVLRFLGQMVLAKQQLFMQLPV